MSDPYDTACEHGYLYPSVGGQTPCPHPRCGEDTESTRHAGGGPAGGEEQ